MPDKSDNPQTTTAIREICASITEDFGKPVFASIDDAGVIWPMPEMPENWHDHSLADRARWIGGREDADVVKAAFVLLQQRLAGHV